MGAVQSRAFNRHPPAETAEEVSSRQPLSRDNALGIDFAPSSSRQSSPRIEQQNGQDLPDYEDSPPPTAREVALQAQVDALQRQVQGYRRYVQRLRWLTERIRALERYVTNPRVTRIDMIHQGLPNSTLSSQEALQLDHIVADTVRLPRRRLLSNPTRQSARHIPDRRNATSEPGTPLINLVADLNLNPSIREHPLNYPNPNARGSAADDHAGAQGLINSQPSISQQTTFSGASRRCMQTRRRGRDAYRGFASRSAFNIPVEATDDDEDRNEEASEAHAQPTAASKTGRKKASKRQRRTRTRRNQGKPTQTIAPPLPRGRLTAAQMFDLEDARDAARASAPRTPRRILRRRQLPPSNMVTRSTAARTGFEVLDVWEDSPLRRVQNARVEKSGKKSRGRK